MNAIFDKLKNRSSYSLETPRIDTEDLVTEHAERDKIKKTLLRHSTKNQRKKRSKTAFELLLDNEIEQMWQYCLKREKKLIAQADSLVDTKKLSQKIVLHGMLKDALFPVTPQSIIYINRFQEPSDTKINFLRIPIVRYFIIIAMIATTLVTFGYCFNEVIYATKQIPFQLSISAVSVIDHVYLVATAVLGNLIYFIPKLLKVVYDTFLTSSKISLYWMILLFGSICGIFSIQIDILTPYLTENTLINQLIIAALCGFIADTVYSIFKH